MTWTTEFNETHARELIAEHYPNPTPLESDVIAWMLDQCAYDDSEFAYDSLSSALADLQYGGCASGMVTHLIYYSDIAVYWREYGEECARLVAELADDCGCTIGDMLRDYDSADPLALEDNNRGLIVWAAFEQTAFMIGNALGFEL